MTVPEETYNEVKKMLSENIKQYAIEKKLKLSKEEVRKIKRSESYSKYSETIQASPNIRTTQPELPLTEASIMEKLQSIHQDIELLKRFIVC